MSLQYIRDYYQVPAKRGGKILWTSTQHPTLPYRGTIIGSSGPHLRVRLDVGDGRIVILHPTDNVKYLEKT